MDLIIGLIIFYIIYIVVKNLTSDKEEPKQPKITIEVSGSDGFREWSHESSQPRKKENSKPAKWFGFGESVEIQGQHIPDGLLYIGENLRSSDGYGTDACLINPKLKATPSEPWEGGGVMGYWPQYAHIPSECRGSYLKWLAGGRSEPDAYIGYVFLFFYGLERRMFVDGQKGGISSTERSEIIQEVNRLLKIYGGNRSFRGYANNFLAMEWVLYQGSGPIPDYIDFNDRYCSEPFQVVLAQYVVEGKAIPAEVALQWFTLHPEFSLRTPARRCVSEFRQLFTCWYNQAFGDGIVIKPNKTKLKLEYRAASPSLRIDIKNQTPNLPNPFILKAPLKKIGALVEECTIKLESYSRFLGRKGNVPDSLSAIALLPSELIQQASGSKGLKSLLVQSCEDTHKLIPTAAIYESFGESVPTTIGKKEAENLAALVEGMGYGIIPDVRFHHSKPSVDGEIVIFQKGHGLDFRPSKEFFTVSTILRLGVMVSQIDQNISPEEELTLQKLVQDNRELSSIEKDSLMAFLYWSLRTPQGTAGIKEKLSAVSAAEKTAISHILISVANADGHIDPREVKQLEKLYTTLGLDRKQVTSDIHTLAATNQPVTVGLRDPDTSFSIPTSTSGGTIARGFSLNEELIKIREEETRQVKGVLENVFSEQLEDEDELGNASPIVATTGDLLSVLDPAHQNFFNKLITQDTWEKAALHEICKELGLMVDGAMEVLNEWAFVNSNAPLIDDGELVYVDVDLAKEIING